VTPNGTVLVGWIDTRDGPGGTATYVAGVAERGTRLDRVVHLNGSETCVCCRVSIVAGRVRPPPCCGRKVFPGDVRDMVLSRSADARRTFEAVARSCTPTAGRSPPVGIEVAG
jgi:hypothetical protein